MLWIRQEGVLRENYIILYLLRDVEGYRWAHDSNESWEWSLKHA